MQSVLGQACLIPIGLTEGKLRKKDFCYLVWAWSGAVAHTLLQRVHDTCWQCGSDRITCGSRWQCWTSRPNRMLCEWWSTNHHTRALAENQERFRLQFIMGNFFRIHIRPAVHPNDHLSPGTIADTWLRILFHLKNLFVSPSLEQANSRDYHAVWVHICSPSFEIPKSERAVIMWIWLLWSSIPLPYFLSKKLLGSALEVPGASDAHTLEYRLSLLTSLRSKRLITNSEFKRKRECIIAGLWYAAP